METQNYDQRKQYDFTSVHDISPEGPDKYLTVDHQFATLDM